ncbi:uncharacterized protein Z519_04482 [Cladophialophora bantiana CBS 173.52]|uniref:Guanine nucleotide exchange factor synembryn n=1 Tax=Cladophialophora bantiana (strain ATCC 10958 / CBS 173.52 / CDC B-1940 / NIH 8579) TaxID=1442370 RepID=A0A0D2EX97_CLAB1|nr:uncharacterized protein Z519_04482 [Cladophialophora bantiana CBS 173.52]KIW94506.1 hypothetical protein Z519_04482 [Cladophialophora bantiana CBS 173.52]
MANQTQQNEARALLALVTKDLEAKTLEQKQLEETLANLKVLGRNVNNVSGIYNDDGITTLGSYAFGNFPPSVRREALRCIANALLLLPAARRSSLKLGLDKKATDALQDADDDDEFLLSRILFLLTYDPGIDLKTLIADHSLADTLVKHLSRHADEAKKSTPKSPASPGNVALMETLKLLFNGTSIRTDQFARFRPAIVELFRILIHSDVPSPALQPPISLLVNALANLDIDPEITKASEVQPTVDKLMTILERAIQEHSSTELDTNAVPLLTVLRNINEAAGPELRNTMRTRLLPDDKERDQPLGKSSSLASQLLRLTTSSGTLNLSEAISGLMFELSDKDANQYVRNVGYGYAAGYLMTHKIPIPESAKRSQVPGESSGEIPVNPITGQRLDKEQPIELPEMTREEKEREAERMFVLFERLRGTGVVNVKNPVEEANDQGRFEELSDSDPE